MARRTKAEAQETRHAIMQAAMRQFSQQGWAATSLAAVASEAGVTRGAIYWHFKNKAELLMALWQELCEPISHRITSYNVCYTKLLRSSSSNKKRSKCPRGSGSSTSKLAESI